MTVKKLVYTSIFATLTVVGGFISIPLPFSPVPLTLQLAFSTMAGYVLGAKHGALSQLVYLLLGAIGLPVFSNRTGGIAMLTGPTSGFLWGFVLAALIIGLIRENNKAKQKPLVIFATLMVGLVAIYLTGMLGLVLAVDYSIGEAFMAGVGPFIIPDLIKLAVATFLIVRIKAKLD